MSLPKLNVTIHEAVLPSTDTVIKFRPFLVKEEKLLLTALEDTTQSSMMNAIKGIINNGERYGRVRTARTSRNR